MGPDWAPSILDEGAFRREQQCLAHVWTFLGLTVDVARDGDWLTGSIATRSVFVQRFGSELRGFENLCAHRFYPLRLGERGNGPLRCGYHHWQYDSEGRAVGIPHCRELFGVLPQELDARETQEDFLGEGFAILAAASRSRSAGSSTAPPSRRTGASACTSASTTTTAWRCIPHHLVRGVVSPADGARGVARRRRGAGTAAGGSVRRHAGACNGKVMPPSCRWHDTRCPGLTSRRTGTSVRQRGMA